MPGPCNRAGRPVWPEGRPRTVKPHRGPVPWTTRPLPPPRLTRMKTVKAGLGCSTCGFEEGRGAEAFPRGRERRSPITRDADCNRRASRRRVTRSSDTRQANNVFPPGQTARGAQSGLQRGQQRPVMIPDTPRRRRPVARAGWDRTKLTRPSGKVISLPPPPLPFPPSRRCRSTRFHMHGAQAQHIGEMVLRQRGNRSPVASPRSPTSRSRAPSSSRKCAHPLIGRTAPHIGPDVPPPSPSSREAAHSTAVARRGALREAVEDVGGQHFGDVGSVSPLRRLWVGCAEQDAAQIRRNPPGSGNRRSGAPRRAASCRSRPSPRR